MTVVCIDNKDLIGLFTVGKEYDVIRVKDVENVKNYVIMNDERKKFIVSADRFVPKDGAQTV